MYFVSWIIVGLVSGWLAEECLEGTHTDHLCMSGYGIGSRKRRLLMQSAGFSWYRGSVPLLPSWP